MTTILGKFHKSFIVSSLNFHQHEGWCVFDSCHNAALGDSLHRYSLFFQINSLIFSSSRFYFFILLYIFYFLIIEMISPLSTLVFVFVLLELMFLCSVLCWLCTIGLLVFIDRLKISINRIDIIERKPYMCLVIIVPCCLVIFRALVFKA